jgi:hypothetical protein
MKKIPLKNKDKLKHAEFIKKLKEMADIRDRCIQKERKTPSDKELSKKILEEIFF